MIQSWPSYVDTFFAPKKNANYEIFQFWKTVQQAGEMVEQFTTRLRIATNCLYERTEINHYPEMPVKVSPKKNSSWEEALGDMLEL